MAARWEVAIIGGGVLGLATALALTERFDGIVVGVVEKEGRLGLHQSGRNSGVIHSGLYYRPGSLKARLCVEGADRLVAFCDEHGVPYRRDGKVVVATEQRELPALAELERRGAANGLQGLRRLDPESLADVEPHARGVAALHVPSTGVVDFREVVRALAGLLRDRGVEVRTAFQVAAVANAGSHLRLHNAGGEAVEAGLVVNCAGLYADRLARLMGAEPGVRIVPFRGEYYDVTGPSAALVRTCIYPVPDPALPFLGVHLTRTVTGVVHAGPNAVLALAREGYGWGTIRPAELWDALSYRGFWALARRHWRAGVNEVARSASRARFLRSARRLVPALDGRDLRRGRSGVRAQAVGRDGALLDDFHIVTSPRAVHVLNAPSPAATSSLAIGDHIAGLVGGALGLAR